LGFHSFLPDPAIALWFTTYFSVTVEIYPPSMYQAHNTPSLCQAQKQDWLMVAYEKAF